MDLNNIGRTIGDIFGWNKKPKWEPQPTNRVVPQVGASVRQLTPTTKPKLMVNDSGWVKDEWTPLKNIGDFTIDTGKNIGNTVNSIAAIQNRDAMNRMQEASNKSAQNLMKVAIKKAESGEITWDQVSKISKDVNSKLRPINQQATNVNRDADRLVNDVRSFGKGATNTVVNMVPELSRNLTRSAAATALYVNPDDELAQRIFASTDVKNKNQVSKAVEGFTGKTKKDSDLGYDLGASGTRLAADMALTVGTGGLLPAALHFSEFQSQNLDRALSKDVPFRDAYNNATASAAIQAALEKVGFDKLKTPFGRNLISKIISGGATEGTQEAVQQTADNMMASIYDKDQKWIDENVGKAGLMGFLTGGPAAGAYGSVNTQDTTQVDTTPQTNTPTPQVSKTVDKTNPLSYKSADEYVKAQGKPLYHGTRDTKMTKFDPNYDYELHNTNDAVGQVRDYETPYGRVFLTNDINEGKAYGQNMLETYFKDKPRVKTIKTGDKAPSRYFDDEYNYGKLADIVENEPFDAIRLVDNNGKSTTLTFPELLKTKQQLVEEWNTAHALAPQVSKTKPEVSLKPETKPKVDIKQPVLSPEVDVDSELNNLIYGDAKVDYDVSKAGQAVERYSVGNLTRKLTKPIERGINFLIESSLKSGNRLLRAPGVALNSITRQLGQTDAELRNAAAYHGTQKMGDIMARTIAQEGKKFYTDGSRQDAVHSLLDPELYKKMGVEVKDYTQAEIDHATKLRKILDLTHEGQHNLGFLDDVAYEENKGTYMPRSFDDFFDDDMVKQIGKDSGLELNIFKRKKDLSKFKDELVAKATTDPDFLVALRVQQYERNKAVKQYTDFLAKDAIDEPRSGYVKVPESKAYAGIAGKYVVKEQLENLQGFIYETTVAQHSMALLNMYDRLPLRRGRKMMLTVMNPGVRLGNRTFNYLVTSLNGINPITFTKNYVRGRKMIKSTSPEYREAVEQGIFGSNFVEKELYRTKGIDDAGGNWFQKGKKVLTESYQAVDDEAKMAAYLTLRERGLSPQESSYRTARMLQNYDMVGKSFDIGAKVPVFGKPFGRFSSELIRTGMNTAIDNPARAAGMIGAWVVLTAAMSKLSGEDEEDRKTREGRVGAPRLPFTDISLEMQTPWGAINGSRLMGVSTYNNLTGGSDEMDRLTPFEMPIVNDQETGKPTFNSKGFASDPMIGPLLSLGTDQDFRGKSIADPENKGQFTEPLSEAEKTRNRLNYLRMSYLPLSNEIDIAQAGATGNETYYGKKLNPGQAAARIAGIKVEQFGKKEAQDARDTNAFFEEKKYLDSVAATLPAKEAEAYKRLTGYYKLREKVPNEFDKDSERYKKAPIYNFPEDKWKEYTNNPDLYNLVAEKKRLDNERQGSPIQPEFDNRLSQEFRNQIVANKSMAPGDDVEADERMYTSSEWDTYQKLKKEYDTAAKKYYPAKDGEFVDEMVKHKTAEFPTKGPAKQAYDDAYTAFVEGKGPKPVYNDAVNTDKEKYSEDKRIWTNTERKARGLPPISKEMWDNVTFGYTSDEEKVYKELKYGKGFGGYGGGGSKKTSFKVPLSAGGTISKAKVSSKKTTPFKISYAKVSKPTVKMTKSKV